MTNQEKDQNLDSNRNCYSKKMEKNGIRKREKYPLISYDELPEYMKDNEYILNYYRANWPLKEAFFSIFRWHNETLNVWTHLIGFILFMVLTIANAEHVSQLADFMTMFIRNFPTSGNANISHSSKAFSQDRHIQMDITLSNRVTNEATWPFYVFLAGAMFCLLSSSICHLFSCHSQKLNLFLVQMDYVGIAVMIITSFFPPMYYIFQCSPHWQIVYLIGITILGICTIITLLFPVFSTGKYRSFRAGLFMSMGCFGLVPAVHALVLNWTDPMRNVTLAYESAMALCYIIGAIFYVSRIPEKWKPGLFDIIGHSHQIFHTFVIFGALAHYGAARIFLDYRTRLGCDKR
ncbi:heptahelical transmembrane protein 1 [Nicotiana tabacum]|uniref:Heptahelical transmembrane protein 1 n=1 Tax=Nicotiana tabacum TaxID=4097 RepID=A0A1S4AJA3_TOBAC